MDNVNILLESLISNLKEGIHIVDSKGKTIYYNHAMENIEGMKSEDVMGKEIQEYLRDIEHSTILGSLKSGHTYRDTLQNYSNGAGKIITSVNSTIPVMVDGKVEAVIEIARDMTQIKKLNETICQLENKSKSKKNYYTFNDIIGSSKVLNEEILKSKRASISNSSVLIYGETGCGKELFAQGIHYEGIRRDKPFIAINCAAIPSALLEGMLFGTVKGSFTGAENKKGLFEEAHRGTILLDEINSMDPYLQSKLLRVLQDGYIRPLGSNKIIDIDVRIIATINEEADKLIREGKLRKDFYYRLSVIKVMIPPLRERKEDISQLCDFFINYYNGILYRNVKGISEDVMEGFLNYSWPGNVRELKNNIESAMNMVEDGEILTKECFGNKINSVVEVTSEDGFRGDIPLNEYIDSLEKNIIEKSYKKNNKNITKTSEELKISRQNLQYKLKKYKLL
ncbi:sigma-54 interaction domain-containing protein [Clostridium sp. UBA3887]|uniref:sigma-54 interaction domain-containing protein n=1 Tax=Clostridium sp. UBA3887 TaxID=1946356 RepID=UPI000E878F05|nr:sigma-54-dependent Fis family transcriptional regulator [Clostridium sp.]